MDRNNPDSLNDPCLIWSWGECARERARERAPECLDPDSASQRGRVELQQMYSLKRTLPQTAFINLGRNIAVQDYGNYTDWLSRSYVWFVCTCNSLMLQTRAVYHCPSRRQITKILSAELCHPSTASSRTPNVLWCCTDQMVTRAELFIHPFRQLIHNCIALPHYASASLSTYALIHIYTQIRCP